MLTCSNCGNDRGWRDVKQTRDGRQKATCAQCGHREVRHGGVVMESAKSMDQSK